MEVNCCNEFSGLNSAAAVAAAAATAAAEALAADADLDALLEADLEDDLVGAEVFLTEDLYALPAKVDDL